ncbi:MAG: hypothetical protein K9M57_10500 [Phycisphaerae bacterium]|nr:hypothetical protein [Phycisphaerae bacterium]
MKAEERHKLKSNELEETISKEMQYFRDHWQQGLTVVGVVLIGLAGYLWTTQILDSRKMASHEGLQNSIVQLDMMKYQAANQARLASSPEDTEAQLDEKPFNSSDIIANLSELSGSDVDMMATLQKAEAFRSQLYFKTDNLSASEKAEICKNARELYQQVISNYSKEALAVGAATVGLGLIAEEKGEWDKAKEIYQAIIADKASQFAGTIYPTQAQKRLEQLEDINEVIVFSAAPPVIKAVENTESQPDATANEDATDSPAEEEKTPE